MRIRNTPRAVAAHNRSLYVRALQIGVVLPPRGRTRQFYEARAEACFKLGDWKGLVWAVQRMITREFPSWCLRDAERAGRI